jgi:murein DD-endopeptidase MepM/ murein hydrolase activator NlpD
MATNGKNVRIKHVSGATTYYLHMSRLDVTAGQHVRQGQVIGLSGNTGHSTGPHLHFSYGDPSGVLRDPAKILAGNDPPPAPARRTIKLGSRGPEVAYLQRKLKVKPADALFGPLTRNAVVKFQKANHLAADGIVGPATWRAIG